MARGRPKKVVEETSEGAAELGPLMKEMDKRYGVGVIRKGSEVLQPLRISTGVFVLDFCLLGGIPVSRGTMLIGKKHSGKTTLSCKLAAQAQLMFPDQQVAVVDVEGCIIASSRFIDMESGQVHTAQEVFDRKLPVSVRSYDEVAYRVSTESLSAWFDNGVRPVLSIQTSSCELTVTNNHKLWARASLNSAPEWVRADTLEEGWYVASPGVDRSWDWVQSEGMDSDTARFIGLMLGDGSFGGGGSPTFCNVDEDVISDMRNIVTSWGGELVTYSDRHHRLIGEGKASKWHPAKATEILKMVGLYGVTGSSKFIPSEVIRSGRGAVLQCLSGLYLTDGTVDKGRPTITLSNTSLTIVEQVQEMWRRLGVPGTIRTSKMYQEHHAQQYTFSINSVQQLRKVADLMPLYGAKGERLAYWAGQEMSTARNGLQDRFGYGLHWFAVQDITPMGEQQTYDFTVPRTHNYVVNNLVAHNTFDEVWARKNEVNTDMLIVAHPESGEAACDITDALIRTREISMVIVDSVAALAPMKEITSSAEDAHVGLQARLMGGLLRKTTAGMITERRRGHLVTPVYINQYRSKIGGFSGFGEPLSVPGGHALGFANSVEIVIKNKENVGKNEQGIDAMAFNEHAYNIPKNKCNGGTRSGEFRLMRQYDPKTGLGECAVDDAGTMLAYAKKYGAYSGAGSAWNLVFWDEDHKFRGADDAISNLYADGELYQKLRDYLIWENAKSLEMPQYFLDRFTEPHGYEP